MQNRTMMIGLVALSGLLLLGEAILAYEQPQYEIIDSDGPFELRRYESYLVAETAVEGNFDDASSQAFLRLFRYISGKERREARPDDPKIAMTVPVTMRQDGDLMRMTFMLPRELTLETAPQPADPRISLRLEAGGLIAVHRYSGRPTQGRFEEHRQALESWILERDLTSEGSVLMARYDGPFKPFFLRRNEVLMPVLEDN